MTHPAAPGRAPRRRRGWVRPALAAAFVLVPLVEIWAILQVGQLVGAWWTIVLLVLDSMVGAWLIKREGGRAWQALRVSPGFVLDLVGILLILPFTRPVARRLLTSVVERRLVVVPTFGPGTGFGPGNANRPGPGGDGPVVRGDVVE